MHLWLRRASPWLRSGNTEREDQGAYCRGYEFIYGDPEKDPAQLRSVKNTHPDYADFTLQYDLDGNMTLDDKGKTLAYDALGRLSSYDGSGYSYDPLDRLSGQEV